MYNKDCLLLLLATEISMFFLLLLIQTIQSSDYSTNAVVEEERRFPFLSEKRSPSQGWELCNKDPFGTYKPIDIVCCLLLNVNTIWCGNSYTYVGNESLNGLPQGGSCLALDSQCYCVPNFVGNTLAYWQTHNSMALIYNNRIPWPSEAESTLLGQWRLLELVNALYSVNVSGGPWLSLAKEWICWVLNYLSGRVTCNQQEYRDVSLALVMLVSYEQVPIPDQYLDSFSAMLSDLKKYNGD